jgi:hypothetical protein
MPYVNLYVELDDFDEDDLIEEIEDRGYTVTKNIPQEDLSDIKSQINELIDAKVYYPAKFDAMFADFVDRFNGRVL